MILYNLYPLQRERGLLLLRGLILDRRRRAWQHVAEVEPDHVLMRALGCTRRQRPWIAEEVGVLQHHLQGPEFTVSPDRLGEAYGAFLRGFVVTVRRTRKAVADPCFTIGVERRISANVDPAVVRVKLRVLS